MASFLGAKAPLEIAWVIESVSQSVSEKFGIISIQVGVMNSKSTILIVHFIDT